LQLQAYDETRAPNGERIFAGSIAETGSVKSVSGRGNGLISSVLAGIRDGFGIELEVVDYVEHAIGHGSDVQAAAYVECRAADGGTVWGVGIDEDVATASVRAVLSAANRAA
jgi:2-isopropylmalate synthase